MQNKFKLSMFSILGCPQALVLRTNLPGDSGMCGEQEKRFHYITQREQLKLYTQRIKLSQRMTSWSLVHVSRVELSDEVLCQDSAYTAYMSHLILSPTETGIILPIILTRKREVHLPVHLVSGRAERSEHWSMWTQKCFLSTTQRYLHSTTQQQHKMRHSALHY